MSNQDWNINKVKPEEIAHHLKDEHQYPFHDRRSLDVNDFIFEHFPALIRPMEEKNYGYLRGDGRKRILKARQLLSQSLKICEKKSIPIAKVYDFNESNEGQWRICKPTNEQLAYLKFKRWFASAEGYFNKTLLQESMIQEADVDELLSQLKETIKKRQEVRVKVKLKKNGKNKT
ncbi:MAG: hypothetical protein ACTSQ4_02290 [Candidatus Heimdallarchaeaceae archaeon]